MKRVTTASAAETERIGGEIAAGLSPGDIVIVSGEVGAGKTTLIRGACRALGVAEPVTSPTFTIGQSYSGRMPVSHLDLYRLHDMDQEDPALLDDYVQPGSVTFIEWPAVAEPDLAGRAVLEVRLSHGGGDSRSLEIATAAGPE